MSKFKEGDRVRIITPSTFSGYCEKSEWVGRTGTIQDMTGDHNIQVNVGDDWFPYCADNLRLFTKGGDMKPNQRKTYRQLKDTPNVKKGAIWQEACDDGTQEYDLISKEHDLDSRPNKTRSIWNRSLVEDQPAWFEEVFQVQPQYMTQAELDEWEAFKKTKTPAKRKVGRPSKK